MDIDLLTEKTVSSPVLDLSTRKRLRRFAEQTFSQNTTYTACTFRVTAVDPLTCLSSVQHEKNFHYYWEKPSENFALAAAGQTLTVTAEGTNRFTAIDGQRQQVIGQSAVFTEVSHPQAGFLFLGGFSFFDETGHSYWKSFDAASLTVPEWLVVRNGKQTIATVFTDTRLFRDSGNLYRAIINQFGKLKSRIDKARNHSFADTPDAKPSDSGLSAILTPEYNGWASTVKAAKELIRGKRFEKIVLSRRFTVERDKTISNSTLLHRLRDRYPNCSCFLIHPPGGNSFLGATPEKLVSFRDDLLFTEALAGSIQRGSTQEEDSMLENDLTKSKKNAEEHQFVIRDIEQRLRPLSKDIWRNATPEIKKLSNVQHLYTPIRAELKSDKGILSVLGQLHPTPAVGGYPWKEARPYIRELEKFERGWYAGPVGWLTASGSGEFAVAIRSGLLCEDKAHFFAGCGIVADSDPRLEWEETNLKLKPMLSALQYD